MPETQVLFRVEDELLEALDRVLRLRGFKTRNEWFRAQIRQVLEEEADRKRLMKALDRLTVEGVTEDDVVLTVKAWRSGSRGGSGLLYVRGGFSRGPDPLSPRWASSSTRTWIPSGKTAHGMFSDFLTLWFGGHRPDRSAAWLVPHFVEKNSR